MWKVNVSNTYEHEHNSIIYYAVVGDIFYSTVTHQCVFFLDFVMLKCILENDANWELKYKGKSRHTILSKCFFMVVIFSMVVDLQCSVNFYCTAKWHSHSYMIYYDESENLLIDIEIVHLWRATYRLHLDSLIPIKTYYKKTSMMFFQNTKIFSTSFFIFSLKIKLIYISICTDHLVINIPKYVSKLYYNFKFHVIKSSKCSKNLLD